MANEVCVCGHPVSEHTAMIGKDRGCRAMVQISPSGFYECNCDKCRPVLPWPDAAGYWWCSDGAIVEVLESATGLGVYVYESDSMYVTIDEWNRDHDPDSRFTRLLEPNPFTEPTDGK